MTHAEISKELKRLINDATESAKDLEAKIADFVTKRPNTDSSEETAYRYGWTTANYDYLLKRLVSLTAEIDKGAK